MIAPDPSWADAHEFGFALQPTAGVATLTDDLAPGQRQSAGLVGAAARFSWAWHDWLQFDIESHFGRAGEASFEVDIDGNSRQVSRGRTTVLGVDASAVVRYGVVIVPTAGVGVGPGLRLQPATHAVNSSGAPVAAIDAVTAFDLFARAHAGVELRLSPRWLAGARIQARQALGFGDGGFRSLEVGLWAGYYYYPRGWFTF